jgi:hypothetical protein
VTPEKVAQYADHNRVVVEALGTHATGGTGAYSDDNAVVLCIDDRVIRLTEEQAKYLGERLLRCVRINVEVRDQERRLRR